MTTSEQPRTAAATRAVVRRGEETKAAALREAGWLVIPPEYAREAAAVLNGGTGEVVTRNPEDTP